MRCSQGDNAVAGEALSVQPVGHPISSSRKRGFKAGLGFEESAPGFKIARAGREERQLVSTGPARLHVHRRLQ